MRKVHLNKSGSGMASMTACGRNILRTPLSVNWTEYKQESLQYRCTKCESSKQFSVNTRMDSRNASLVEAAQAMGKLQFIHIG
jgi:hypothetical protein